VVLEPTIVSFTGAAAANALEARRLPVAVRTAALIPTARQNMDFLNGFPFMESTDVVVVTWQHAPLCQNPGIYRLAFE
jgi:hypothetical protein